MSCCRNDDCVWQARSYQHNYFNMMFAFGTQTSEAGARQKEMKRIDAENQRLLKRLQGTKRVDSAGPNSKDCRQADIG